MDHQQVLKTAIGLLEKYPNSHIGGSLGLYLHGLKLGRPIKDLDICLAFDPGTIPKDSFIESSNNDFDYIFEWNGIRIDVIIAPNQTFSLIEYGGYNYRVTDFYIIYHYKQKYCAKDITKHCTDCNLMRKYIGTQFMKEYQP